MPDYTNWAIANQAVMNPATPVADLNQIANAQPSLRAAVAMHPAAYPALLDWLAAQGDPNVQAAVASRRQGANQPYPPTPTYAPTPSYAPTTTYAPSPIYAAPAPRGASSGMRVGLIVGGLALVVIIALILGFTVFNSKSKEVDSFNTAKSNYAAAQTALTSQITKAQAVADSGDGTMIDDASLLETLKSDLKTAKAYRPITVTMASSKSEIAAQVTKLDDETTRVNDMTQGLKDDVSAVQDSQVSWAKTLLSDAIDEATTILNDVKGKVDGDAQSVLSTAINDAKTTLTGFDTADPATVGSAAQAAVQALKDAEAGVQQPATPPCAAKLPAGIDPMVCGGMPADALSVPWTFWSDGDMLTQMFVTAAGDVGCMNFSDRLECDVKDATWTMPGPLLQTQICVESQNCGGEAVAILAGGSITAWPRSDVPDYQVAQMEGVKLPTLQYGQTADLTTVACYADVPGLTCWDVNTHHGFQMASTSFLYW